MADEKNKDVQKPDPEVHGAAVQSVTENVSHPADASSEPGPYVVDGEPMPVNRPGVSTNVAGEEIAQTLVAGAGAPTPPEAIDAEPLPEEQKAEAKPLTAEQKENAEPVELQKEAKK